MIFEEENHRIPSHYDLHIENFNSFELKFSIEYQYEIIEVICIIYISQIRETVVSEAFFAFLENRNLNF